ncbi:hypothetical protein JXB22_08625 [candidate division WOR-3 bacterium]|nr:hypothetical protein [candidate division WOR-3 bacterium]
MKYVAYTLICLTCYLTTASAQAPTGIYGFVYNNNSQKAGSQLDYIYIYNTSDQNDSAFYHYNPTDSKYVTNDTYGLYDGIWRLQGEITNGETKYWSTWYVVAWEYPDYTQQDLHCTSSVRPLWCPDK